MRSDTLSWEFLRTPVDKVTSPRLITHKSGVSLPVNSTNQFATENNLTFAQSVGVTDESSAIQFFNYQIRRRPLHGLLLLNFQSFNAILDLNSQVITKYWRVEI